MYPQLSIILPALNEAGVIAQTLQSSQTLRAQGCEVIVVDGGSSDETESLALPLADRVLRSAPGRAHQMNLGAGTARAPILLFLHADTQLPEQASEIILHALSAQDRVWGRFDVRLSGSRKTFRLIEALMNLRSRLTGIATGDQAIFVLREAFFEVGCYPNIALMEDIALSAALKKIGPPITLRDRVITSSRRWETQGVWRTILRMWWLRLRNFLGADPARLAQTYDTRADVDTLHKPVPVFEPPATHIVTQVPHD